MGFVISNACAIFKCSWFHDIFNYILKTSRLGKAKLKYSFPLFSISLGTDINAAIQTGSSLLSNYLFSTGGHHNSVSLIIFLTDGRPTVGELKSPNILSNAKSAVQEQFCIFTIGIGNDVDYRLLERMSLENCGMMRRIHEDSDASAMLKGFVRVPLCSALRRPSRSCTSSLSATEVYLSTLWRLA